MSVSRVERFLDERRGRWERLEALLDRADRESPRSLGPEALQELVVLYRQACSDLHRVRALTANPDVLGHLNRLTGRAYRVVHGAGLGRRSVRSVLRDFYARDAPRTLRAEWRHLLAAVATTVLGAVLGFLAVASDPGQAHLLVPDEFFQEDVAQRVQRIESSPERISHPGEALEFGASLYAHNIRVGFLAFGLGAMTLVLAHLLLFQNGIILGAITAQYVSAGASSFFVAWVGPHGSLELPAIILSAAAGTKLGAALLLPGDLTRRDAVLRAGPAACRILAAAASLFVVAGLIEGSLSQMTARTVPFAIKIGIAAALACGLLAWILVPARDRRAA